jgi:hypothetical protein
MAEVPRTATPLSMPDVARIGARTFASFAGRLPTRGMLAILVGIIGLENAGGRAILQHNWGNISGEGPAGYWTHPKPTPGQPLKFRAYRSQDEGALAWWRLVLRRYRAVLERGDAHDPRGAVHQLYRLGYVVAMSPGEETVYANAVEKLYRAALQTWIPAAHVYPSPAIALAVGLGSAGALLGAAGSNVPRNAALAGLAAGASGGLLGALLTPAAAPSRSPSTAPPPAWPTAEPSVGQEEAGAAPWRIAYTWQRGQHWNHPEAVGQWFRGPDVGPLRGGQGDVLAPLGAYWQGWLRVWTYLPATWFQPGHWALTYDGHVTPGFQGQAQLDGPWKSDRELAA